MNIGVYMKLGIDIIEIERIQKAIEKSESFLKRVYREDEISYCKSKGKGCYQSFSGVYAGKEAFLKALGTGMRHGSWQDIEIHYDSLGAPQIRLYDTFLTMFNETGHTKIHISISHCQSMAISEVIFE